MKTKQRKGRTFIGTLFLLGIGFLAGSYRQEIYSFAKQAVQSISH